MRFYFTRVTSLVALLLSMTGCQVLPLYSSDTAILQQALQQGADPNMEWRGVLPLDNALYAGSPRNENPTLDKSTQLLHVRLLLEAGANPNALPGHGQTALNRAATQCRPDLVRLLLQHGADPFAISEVKGTPTSSTTLSATTDGFCPTVDDQYAVAYILLDHVERKQGREAMLAYARMTAPRSLRFVPMPVLHRAAWQKYYGVLAALIAKRVDLDQLAYIGPAGQQLTALHIAESVGSKDIADALRRAGARDSVLSSQGETALAMRDRYTMNASALEIANKLAKGARQVQSLDLYGIYKDGEKDGIIQAMHEGAQAINQPAWILKANGGPVKPPAGWTGLDEAIRKAHKAAQGERKKGSE